jgi:hypothetical protein
LRCSGWHRPPFPCGCGFILSSALVALQSSSPSRSRPSDRSLASSSPKGFCPLRDISTRSPLGDGFLTATYVPPSAFLALSTVYSSCCLTGLFRPVATSWILSPGGFPISQPLWFIASASRLVVFRHSPTGEQALLLQLVPPRLHGFDSGCWSVATYRCFTPVCNSIPS